MSMVCKLHLLISVKHRTHTAQCKIVVKLFCSSFVRPCLKNTRKIKFVLSSQDDDHCCCVNNIQKADRVLNKGLQCQWYKVRNKTFVLERLICGRHCRTVASGAMALQQFTG